MFRQLRNNQISILFLVVDELLSTKRIGSCGNEKHFQFFIGYGENLLRSQRSGLRR